MKDFHLLSKNELPGEIEIHSDLLAILPSALSRKRALKVGQEPQEEMQDSPSCIACDPSRKQFGTSPVVDLIKNRVARFDNDYPYMSGDQQVLFLWHDDAAVRKEHLHRYRLRELGRRELYWLLRGCVERGKGYEAPNRDHDLVRMVAGFNLGRLAGQSLAHFHVQYGWEVVVNRRTISQRELDLYFEELAWHDLILYRNERITIVAPWTPKGQYALEVYFNGKFEILELDDEDLRIFACLGSRLVQKYVELGIQNLNIVLANSPKGRKTEPLVVHFVPRVNMAALYEIKGVNVVDTPPQKIAEEFRRLGAGGRGGMNWAEILKDATTYDPNGDFETSCGLRP
jgi:galactose-1-phosphate uridylyltransferase